MTNPVQRKTIELILEGVLNEHGIETWWHVPNSRLAGHTPEACLEQGFFEPVYKLALSYLDPSFS